MIMIGQDVDNFPCDDVDLYDNMLSWCPDQIMKRDLLEDQADIAEVVKANAFKSSGPPCVNCTSLNYSADRCRLELDHVEPSHKFNSGDLDEYMHVAQLLAARSHQLLELEAKKKKAYQRWRPSERHSLFLCMKLYGDDKRAIAHALGRSIGQVKAYMSRLTREEVLQAKEGISSAPPGYVPPPILESLFVAQMKSAVNSQLAPKRGAFSVLLKTAAATPIILDSQNPPADTHLDTTHLAPALDTVSLSTVGSVLLPSIPAYNLHMLALPSSYADLVPLGLSSLTAETSTTPDVSQQVKKNHKGPSDVVRGASDTATSLELKVSALKPTLVPKVAFNKTAGNGQVGYSTIATMIVNCQMVHVNKDRDPRAPVFKIRDLSIQSSKQRRRNAGEKKERPLKLTVLAEGGVNGAAELGKKRLRPRMTEMGKKRNKQSLTSPTPSMMQPDDDDNGDSSHHMYDPYSSMAGYLQPQPLQSQEGGDESRMREQGLYGAGFHDMMLIPHMGDELSFM
jgi:hypothetical protein